MPSNDTLTLDAGGVHAIQRVAQQAFAAQPLSDGEIYAVAVTARFRYRIDEGQLFLGVRLIESEKVLETAFEALVAEVQQALPVPILRGVG